MFVEPIRTLFFFRMLARDVTLWIGFYLFDTILEIRQLHNRVRTEWIFCSMRNEKLPFLKILVMIFFAVLNFF